MGDIKNTYKVLVVNLGGKRPLRRSRWKWEDNIRIVLKEIDLSGLKYGPVVVCLLEL
jgi:hypothetical protein